MLFEFLKRIPPLDGHLGSSEEHYGKEAKEYFSELGKSKGYVVNSKFGKKIYGGVRPIDLEKYKKTGDNVLWKIANFAVSEHNRHLLEDYSNYKLSLVNILRVNYQMTRFGAIHYMTFSAKDASGIVDSYRARVLACYKGCFTLEDFRFSSDPSGPDSYDVEWDPYKEPIILVGSKRMPGNESKINAVKGIGVAEICPHIIRDPLPNFQPGSSVYLESSFDGGTEGLVCEATDSKNGASNVPFLAREIIKLWQLSVRCSADPESVKKGIDKSVNALVAELEKKDFLGNVHSIITAILSRFSGNGFDHAITADAVVKLGFYGLSSKTTVDVEVLEMKKELAETDSVSCFEKLAEIIDWLIRRVAISNLALAIGNEREDVKIATFASMMESIMRQCGSACLQMSLIVNANQEKLDDVDELIGADIVKDVIHRAMLRYQDQGRSLLVSR